MLFGKGSITVKKFRIALGALAALLLVAGATAQTQSNPVPAGTGGTPLPRFGLGVGAGTLGAGIQAATAVARRTNIRGGFNYFPYNLSGTGNGLSYSGKLRLESAELLVDEYLAGPLHISAGALVYNGFQATGSVNVPGGQTFTLNGTTYFSEATNPVTGTGAVTVRKAAPEVLFGLGNLLPRGHRHFGVNFDLGVVFQGSPSALLNLNGSTCVTPLGGCSAISANSTVQANIAAEQNKINKDLKPFGFYPVLRITFGSKF